MKHIAIIIAAAIALGTAACTEPAPTDTSTAALEEGEWLFDAFTEQDVIDRVGTPSCPDKDNPACATYNAAHGAWSKLVDICDGWTGSGALAMCTHDNETPAVNTGTPLSVKCRHIPSTCAPNGHFGCDHGHEEYTCCTVKAGIAFPSAGETAVTICCKAGGGACGDHAFEWNPI